MRLRSILSAVLMFTMASFVATGAAGPNRGASTGQKEDLCGFIAAVGEYYRIPKTEIVVMRQRGIPTYEIPVVLFIAKRGHVPPEIVTDFRRRDNTWLYTTIRFGLGPEIFYVPVRVPVKDRIYGKAYDYFRLKPQKASKTIVLSDADIVNLVNLKVISEHYDYPPENIIKMRSAGQEFGSIIDEIRKKGSREKELRAAE